MRQIQIKQNINRGTVNPQAQGVNQCELQEASALFSTGSFKGPTPVQ